MTELTLPSGDVFDFGDMPQEDIADRLTTLRGSNPELFEETIEVSEEGPPDPTIASYEELREYYQGRGEEDAPKFETTHEGEIESHSFQYDYGQADTDEERALRLEREFGPGTYERVAEDDFVLHLAQVSPEKKAQYKLPESGTIRVNEPGLSYYDVSRFGGAYKGPLVATLAAGFMLPGLTILPSMVLMGAAGGIGKAYDELVSEELQGLQRQADKEIWGDVATEAITMAAGEGIMRGFFALGRRLIKGPGPRPEAARVDELEANLISQGVSPRTAASQALKAATEEQRMAFRAQIKEGARPSVTAVSGKAMSGRLQAIYEKIFPNRKAAADNRRYVMELFDEFHGGRLTEAELKDSLNRQSQAISSLIEQNMKNPEEAIRLANQQLRGVIKKEFEVLQEMFVPGERLATDFEGMLARSSRMFKAGSDNLYTHAEDLLGDAALFETRALKQAFNEVRGYKFDAKTGNTLYENGKPVMADAQKFYLGSDLAKDKGLFRYVEQLGPEMSLTELSTLRPIIRMVEKDPDLMGSGLGRDIGQIVNTLDDMVKEKRQAINNIWASKGDLGGTGGIAGPGGRFVSPTETKKIKEGLDLYDAANKHYSEGMDVFRSGAIEMVNKNVKNNFFVSFQDVAELMTKPGRAPNLKFWLDAITPDEHQLSSLQKINPAVLRDIGTALQTRNPAEAVNSLLATADLPPGTIPQLPKWIDKMEVDDLYRRSVLDEYVETVKVLHSEAVARANPQAVRDTMRNMLARQWLDETGRLSRRGPEGNFDGPAFADSFTNLDLPGQTVMQDTLFGAENAAVLRKSLKDFYLMGKGTPELTEQILADIAHPNMKRVVGELQNTLKVAEEQSKNALFKAVRNGEIDDADALVMAVMKNPRTIGQLRNALGKDATDILDEPGGLQDMVMQRIMLSAFPDGVTTDAVASGAFGQAMRKTINKMNANGALAKVLTKPDRAGQEVVDNLLNVAKKAERISDASLPETGIAPAAFAAGALLRFLTAPMSFLTEVTGIIAMGRMMRSTPLLKFLTSPQLTSRETRQAIKAGAEGLEVRNLKLLELAEMRNRVIRAITSLQGVDTVREGIVEPVTEVVEEVTEQIQPAIGAAVEQIQPAIDAMTGQAAQLPTAPQPLGPQTAAAVLEGEEMRKLYGVA